MTWISFCRWMKSKRSRARCRFRRRCRERVLFRFVAGAFQPVCGGAAWGCTFRRIARLIWSGASSAPAKEFRFTDAVACMQWLMSAPLNREQVEVLAGNLTVGETYFFREKKTFEALEEHVLPDLMPLRDEMRSGGCESGAQPAVRARSLTPSPLPSEKRFPIWWTGTLLFSART